MNTYAYNYHITITVPATQAVVAAKVGRALDPDTGGANSWVPDGDNITVSTPCRKEFFDRVPIMLANPAILHAAVSADCAARPELWAGEVPPTQDEIEAFCASVIPEPQPPAADPVV